MTSPAIPDEAVTAAAKASHNAYEEAALRHGWETQKRSRVPWADVPEANKATVMDAMRAALVAAAPHLQAAAWQEGHRAGSNYGHRHATRMGAMPDKNPYDVETK